MMVKHAENYSFHLSSADDSIYSDTGSVTSSYKERIDSLFRDKRNQRNPSSLVTTVQVHCSSESPKKSYLQKYPIVTATHSAAVTKKANFASKSQLPKHVHTSVITTNHTPLVTSIHVPPPQAWKAKALTPKEELETIFGGRDQRQQAFHDVRTAVQAKIEKLFADATVEPSMPGVRSVAPKLPSLTPSIPPLPPLILEENSPPPPPLPKNPPPPLPSHNSSFLSPSSASPSPSVTPATSDHVSMSSACSSPVSSPEVTVRKVGGNMRYSIDYLGAIQLADKATSLEVLQEPLKELYYKYRYSISKGRKAVPGELRITEAGIRIVHGVKELPGYYELLNPFPTIAVWAAVKLVIRREVGEHGQMFFSYAFLPLICDPEAQDKYNLYHELNVGAPNVMAGEHPPMFACVMRKVGVPKILECHGFVCRSSEDAIVIAANLYQSLLESMKSGHSSDYSDVRDDDRNVLSDSEIVPIRPPRRKRNSDLSSSRRLKRSSSEDMLRSSSRRSQHRVSKRRIKRSISDRHSFASLDDVELYTKVPLPRSQSFVNVTSKYDFQELLDDVKQKTGLNSVDDVLKQIINPEGMSFSEMDPNYREILLKLALTLSKDEIYQRSKNIMRKQKFRNSSNNILDSDSEGSTISSVLRATKRSFSRLGSRASSLQPPSLKDKSTSKKTQIKNKYNAEYMAKIAESQFAEDLTKINNKMNKKVVPKTPMPKRVAPTRSSDGYGSCSECGYESECSSKCYCSLPRDQIKSRSSTLPNKKVLHRAKSTCCRPLDSFCECDTESCAESEKCYCSLKTVKKNGLKMYEINLDSETDTDITIRSAGSLVSRGYGSQSSNNQQQRNSSPYLTENSKSRSAGTVFSLHPEEIRQKSKSSHFSSDSDNSINLRRSRSSSISHKLSMKRSSSSEFLSEKPRMRRHPSGSVGSGGSQDSHDSNSSCRSSIGSAIEEGSQRSRASNQSQQKILLVSAVDPSGKVVYRGASQKQRRENSDTTSILSMKKTAEIAALFSELKLNQTTDLIQQTDQSTSDSEDDAYSSMQANSSFLFSDNIENSLGYLP